jgi:hypothetical protein
MKKVFTLVAVASMFSFVACGPSEEEKAKIEEAAKKQMDSIFNAASQSLTADTTAAAPATTEPAATEEHAAPATEEKKH